jgi:hypothetical protein
MRTPLRWRREPRATGLARVCQGERGYELRRGGVRVGHVSVLYEFGKYSAKLGYYWSARIGTDMYNSCSDRPILQSPEEAKAQC